jgi:hypothetical protein
MAFEDQSALLSEFSDHIDQYGGAVDGQFAKSSIMREFFDVNNITGTDTMINDRVGRTVLQKLNGGQRTEATKTNFGKVSVTVDTVIIARDQRTMLNEFQTRINARVKLGQDHGKEMAKFFDEAFMIMGIHGAGYSATAGLQTGTAAPTGIGGTSLNGAFGAGKVFKMASANDELDAAELYAAIKAIILKMKGEEIDAADLVIFVNADQHEVLVQNDFLIDKDLSDGNGDRAANMIKVMMGVRIVETQRIPSVVNSTHHLGAGYNVSANDAKCVALVLHPSSLLVGETIPLQSKVWFNDEEKMWFIDSWIAFGVAVDRADVCGAVYKAG